MKPRAPKFCPQCATALSRAERAGRERLVCSSEACGWVHWDNPLPVVAALVEHPSGIVLVRNVGWPETWFGLVTGFLERDESPEQGILREIEEELGLQAEIVGWIGLYPFPLMNQLIMAWHVRAEGPIIRGEELAATKSVPVDRLKPWPFGTGQAVADWLARRAGG